MFVAFMKKLLQLGDIDWEEELMTMAFYD